MNKSHKFSIVIPVYNVESFLPDCLDSVFKQTYTDYEIICVDDCSTDLSLSVLYRIKKTHPELQVIKNNTNMGLSATRNIGIKLAEGEFIIFIDSDDLISTEALEILNNILVDDLDVLYFNWERIDIEGTLIEKRDFWKEREKKPGRDLFIELMEGGYERSACAAVYRRLFLIQNDLFFEDSILHEDILFSIECMLKAQCTLVINKVLYKYRIRDGSITSEMSKNRAFSLIIIMSRLLTIWDSYQGDYELDLAIRKYIYSIFCTFKRYQRNIGDLGRMNMGTEKDKLLYSIMTCNDELFSMIEDFSIEDIERLKNAGQIWIYGAGIVGYDVLTKLKEIGIQPRAFLVTKGKKTGHYNGFEVLEFNDSLVKSNDVVIIAVGKKYYKQVYSSLSESLTNNIISVSLKQ